MTKYTHVDERVFLDNEVVGHAIPRCMLWDGGHGVQTSIVKMHDGQDLGWHKHDSWVQVFVLSGKIYCSLDNRTCGPGDFYFVEPGDVHLEKALEESQVMIIKAMPNIQYPVPAMD
uniref:cupin domain-containing protein n=1 Tax=Cupriavidus yeoncheonensis TaxID=1462994 RepID=UPI003F49501A